MARDSWNFEIFTTNYDLVIESAINYSKRQIPGLNIHMGYKSGAQQSLDMAYWSNTPNSHYPTLNGKSILVTKLHGSVDWSPHNNKIIVGGAFYKGSHDKHSILYPGYKGTPDTEPFQSFHSRFKNAIQKASHLITIGFAFRDKAINDIISESSSTLRSLVIIDPSDIIPPTGVPKKHIKHIKQGFNSDSVHDAFKHLTLV